MPRSLLKSVLTLATSLLLACAGPAAAAAVAPSPAFNVAVHGSGTPIILIPGLSSSGAVWDGTVRHYCGQQQQQQRQCHVLTLAGFAGVAPISTPLLATAEQQLSDYIAANHLGQPIVIGHSLGGFLGMKLAADHPDQVGRLVIVDTLPALGARQMPSITRAQLKEVGTGMREQMLKQDNAVYETNLQTTIASMVTKPDDIALVMGWSRQSDRSTVANAMYEMMTDDMRDDVARIKAPTLVLGSWIAYKQYAPRASFEALYVSQYQKLDGVKVELSDTARHFIMVDDPEWMYARIDAILK